MLNLKLYLGAHLGACTSLEQLNTDYDSYDQVRKLTLEMQIKEPSIVFHPSNKYSFPQPRTINNVSKEF